MIIALEDERLLRGMSAEGDLCFALQLFCECLRAVEGAKRTRRNSETKYRGEIQVEINLEWN